MLITENTLRKIIAEEYENLKKESGMGPRSQTPMGRFIDRANAATPPQSNDNKPTFYDQLKEKLKNKVSEEEIKEFIETTIKDMKPVAAYAKLNQARLYAIGDGNKFLSQILNIYTKSGNK